jgi:cell division protein FtsL
MDTKRLFLLTILLIFVTIIITENNKDQIMGEVQKITYSTNKITLEIEDYDEEVVLFTKKILDIKKSDKLKIYGKKNTYKNKEQIIAHKIIKTS